VGAGPFSRLLADRRQGMRQSQQRVLMMAFQQSVYEFFLSYIGLGSSVLRQFSALSVGGQLLYALYFIG